MAFSVEVRERAWYRQGGLCAACGKELVFENCERGYRGAWHPHHRDPEGTDTLRNFVILCINPPNCHLNIGHDGNWRTSVVLYDSDLTYLYAGRSQLSPFTTSIQLLNGALAASAGVLPFKAECGLKKS